MAWDRDALPELRGAVYRGDGDAVLAALDGRALADVLQLAGDGLVAARAQGVPGADALAGSRHCAVAGSSPSVRGVCAAASAPLLLGCCAEELRARGLDGDAELLADRLQRAIRGRGAFRSFRDVLEDHPDELTRYALFADERARGRARRWLAENGLRPSATAARSLSDDSR